MPLNLERRDVEYLKNLCTDYRSKISPMYYTNVMHLRSYEPTIQTHYLSFRRVTVLPAIRSIRVQVIRCGEKTALIDAGDGLSGYILVKASSHVTAFYIHGKFTYRPGRAETIPMSQIPVFQVAND